MSSAATELTYHGRPLTAQPRNMTLGDAVGLLEQGKVAHVTLEPGDGTRYDLVLAPEADIGQVDAIAVTRTAGWRGDFLAGAVIVNPEGSDARDLDEEFERLACCFPWSAALFRWWFHKLWERINA